MYKFKIFNKLSQDRRLIIPTYFSLSEEHFYKINLIKYTYFYFEKYYIYYTIYFLIWKKFMLAKINK